MPVLITALAVSMSVAAVMAHAAGESETAGSGGNAAQRPVVLELFTSQGCSSCPPADRLAGKLAQDPSLVVITRPVTYWDRLGWKDTLARPENTALQRAYSRRISTGKGVYTPQIVIDGQYGVIGSREKEIRTLISRTRRSAGPALAVEQAEGGGFGIGLSGKASYRLELVLVALDSTERVAIGRGENSGRHIAYTNVVRAERRLGDWRGGTQSFRIPASQLSQAGADRYALLLRQPDGGVVVAAAMLPADRN
ncbi:MAG: DUF1223 domain-containing protein [Novosphingobium sp.]|nr:DUF1223 domain-containing protein [Novosphingobium sp.]